jgi:hypothetical protein
MWKNALEFYFCARIIEQMYQKLDFILYWILVKFGVLFGLIVVHFMILSGTRSI